jgi:hypothetical protein
MLVMRHLIQCRFALSTLATFLCVALVIMSMSGAFAQTATAPAGWAPPGDNVTVYELATLDNLYWLSQTTDAWDESFKLTADIDAVATETWNGGAGFSPIAPDTDPSEDYSQGPSFTGTFDGQGHKITGLTINWPSKDSVALFGTLAAPAEIRDVGLVGCAVTGHSFGVAALAAYAGAGSAISNCWSTGQTTGTGWLGFGGLVGINHGNMTQCCSAVAVTGDQNVGGLVGWNAGTIENCFSTGPVSGNQDVGGLLGENQLDGKGQAIITNCYSTGFVMGTTNVGGLVGFDDGGASTSSYWNTQSSGQATSAFGAGKTTAEMIKEATFSGWDFTTIWGIDENSSYPYLQTMAEGEDEAEGEGLGEGEGEGECTDASAPVAVCRDLTVALSASGTVLISAEDINNGSEADCGIAFLQVDQRLFVCDDVGPNTVTLTVVDGAGNSATCEAIVTVTDPLDACTDSTEGETPAEGEGEGEAATEGEAPAEGEGEGETATEGEAPAEGEGEGEAPAEGEDGGGSCGSSAKDLRAGLGEWLWLGVGLAVLGVSRRSMASRRR